MTIPEQTPPYDNRPILVATDLGEGADEAVVQADAWARRVGAALVVCHVMPDFVRVHPLLPHLAGRDAAAIPALHSRVRQALVDRVTRLTGRGGGEFDIILEEGPTVTTLLRVVAERRPRLLVVGSSARQPLESALVGSTAAQMCRYAPVSVLAARRGPLVSPLSPVLAATDFSVAAGVALSDADDEASRRGVQLALVHALDIDHPVLAAFDASVVLPREAVDALHVACRETLQSARTELRSKGTEVVAEDAPGPAVAHTARELQAQLVVVGTHGRSGLRHLALGSSTEAILHRSPCSVLIVRPE